MNSLLNPCLQQKLQLYNYIGAITEVQVQLSWHRNLTLVLFICIGKEPYNTTVILKFGPTPAAAAAQLLWLKADVTQKKAI